MIPFSKRLAKLIMMVLLVPSGMVATVRRPQPVAPELNDKWLARQICQSDFASGTFRITEPGCYYLSEDIVFNPDKSAELCRGDKPALDWFAAISIEAPYVTLDLNTKSIQVSEEFLCKRDIKLFSVIKLGNLVFSPEFASIDVTTMEGKERALQTLSFYGETEIKTPCNVVIRNGTIGRTSLCCIGGFDVSNVQLYDLVCREWETAAIMLPGVKGCSIENVCLLGAATSSAFDYKRAAKEFTLRVLKKLCEKDNKARPHICALEDELKEPKVPVDCVEGTGLSAGIFLGDSCAECVTIDTAKICSIAVAMQEQICVSNLEGDRLKAGPYSLDWFDAFKFICPPKELDECHYLIPDHFQPNALFKAQVYLLSKLNPSLLSSAFLDNILRTHPIESKFLEEVLPCFGCDVFGKQLRGIFGITACGKDITIEDTIICDITNKSHRLGKEICSIPKGNCFTELPCLVKETCHDSCPSSKMVVEQNEYLGNDAGGILLYDTKVVTVARCSIGSVYSYFGDAHGIIGHQARATKVNDCCVAGVHAEFDRGVLVALGDDACEVLGLPLQEVLTVTSVVNPSSQVSGIMFAEHSDATWVENCVVSGIVSPRAACGICFKNCVDVSAIGCKAYDIATTSDEALQIMQEQERKKAIGFFSYMNECAIFNACQALCIETRGEDEEEDSTTSRAAGFLCLGVYGESESSLDLRPFITKSISHCINGGSGIGAGILLDGTLCAAVIENQVSANAALEHGFGKGIVDTAVASTSLVLKNVAFNADDKNYCITFDDEQMVPLAKGTFGNVHPLFCANEWDNILLEKAPGKEQDTSKCKKVLSKIVTCSC